MRRPYGGEVAVVERRDLGLVETLDERNDARVGDTEPEVRVRRLKVAATDQVCSGRRLRAICACEEIVQERELHVAAQALVAPIVELREDERWHDEILACVRDERGAAGVIRVGGVERCEQRSGIEYQRH